MLLDASFHADDAVDAFRCREAAMAKRHCHSMRYANTLRHVMRRAYLRGDTPRHDMLRY